MKTKKNIIVGDIEIVITNKNQQDYISLTDMARYRDKERTDYITLNWLRTRNAIEFCGIWEQMNNPHFQPIDFDGFKNEAGANSFSLTPLKWIKSVDAIGIMVKKGRYGGVFLFTKTLLSNLAVGSVRNSGSISFVNSSA